MVYKKNPKGRRVIGEGDKGAKREQKGSKSVFGAPRVVFVLGFVSLINSLTSGKTPPVAENLFCVLLRKLKTSVKTEK